MELASVELDSVELASVELASVDEDVLLEETVPLGGRPHGPPGPPSC